MKKSGTDLVTVLPGVGEKTAELLKKQGILTVSDLLYYFPRDYKHIPLITPIAEGKENQLTVISGKIAGNPQMFHKGKKMILTFGVKDDSGTIRISFFGMPYLKKTLFPGKDVICMGVLVKKNFGLVMDHPKLFSTSEYEEKKGKPSPVYSLTEGLSNEKIRKALKEALSYLPGQKDKIPVEKQKEYGLLSLPEALEKIHFPKDEEEVMLARKRIVFDEFLAFLWNLEQLKGKNRKNKSDYVIHNTDVEEALLKKLPFSLTFAQKRVCDEILTDLKSGKQMNRLVQGDVGSGKTILAIIAAYVMMKNGYQVALMAPTEVLAKQHFLDVCSMEEEMNLGFLPCILTGSMKAKEKKEAYEKIEAGKCNFIIGTHALIQEKVNYQNLALVITDEQHRFGVKQRASLMKKGDKVHVLVMSATPIPRTLGLILYGDLDVSLVDELPANRLPIKNAVVGPEYRQKLYAFLVNKIAEGRQAYVICPMVEDGEKIEAENVLDYTETLRENLPAKVRIASLHGKMKPAEKERIMQEFKEHTIDILVSTTVVEVGINVPNSTVIMIENAERFGLAQLHQLRGRVGRGRHQSYAVFVAGNDNKKTMERLGILNQTNDGFKIAEEDLKQRGPGDFFGIRQSGLPGFQLADIYSDAEILMQAKNYLSKENLCDIDFTPICL